MSGFMKKLSSVGSSAKQSVVTAKAKAGLAAGVAYNSKSFRTAYGLPDTEPLLDSFTVTLLSGEVTVSGQIYLTPHLICLYTVASGKEVKVKIDLREVDNIYYAYCANSKMLAPAIVQDIPVGAKPNVLRVLCHDQTLHTLLDIAPSEFDCINAIMHVTWDITRGHAVSTFPVPPAGTESHEAFKLHPSEPLLAVTKASVISGNDTVKVSVALFVHYVAFKVGDTPVLIEYRRITNIARCASSPHPDPTIKAPVLTPVETGDESSIKGIQLYTDDGFMHQILLSNSNIQLFYNQLVYVHSLQLGVAPVFW
eukprot:a841386_271.p1 GENE.a841386_271~~a841386_271.p1  ORF type:complete len:322 (+),score=111.43 a841386_271:37-966(+)